MTLALDGKVVIITGSARNLGHVTAQRFTVAGAHVVLKDHNPGRAEAEEAVATVAQHGVRARSQ